MSYGKNKQRVDSLGELTQDDASWIIAILAGDHDMKVAYYGREQVSETVGHTVSDKEWETFEATYEWNNLSDWMYDGGSSGVAFAFDEYSIGEEV